MTRLLRNTTLRSARLRSIVQLSVFANIFLLLACQPTGTAQEKQLQAIKVDNGSISNAAIIKNPVTANQPIDTVNVAQMTFEEPKYKYGEVLAGTIVSHSFKFTNTGKAPLIISECKSTCGCTVPEWPKEPIPPGGEGVIDVRFDTKGKKQYNNKPIFITANTHPAETKIFLLGRVKEK